MKTIELNLYKKSDHEYQLKNGRKIAAKIVQVTDGWHACLRIYPTLERAIEAARLSIEEMNNAFGNEIEVIIKR